MDKYVGDGSGTNQLQYASKRLRDDEEIILYTYEKYRHCCGFLEHASNRLKDSYEFITKINLKGRYLIGKHVSNGLKNNKEFTKYLIQNGCSLDYVSKEFLHNKEIVMMALKNDIYVIHLISNELQDNEEIVRKSVNHDGTCLQFASDRLKNKKKYRN